MPRRLQMSLGQSYGRFRGVPTGGTVPVRTADSKGASSWFTKMDRNHDGDVSEHEFIGSAEDFRKLDANGDGLISALEAQQFEARLIKEKDKKH